MSRQVSRLLCVLLGLMLSSASIAVDHVAAQRPQPTPPRAVATLLNELRQGQTDADAEDTLLVLGKTRSEHAVDALRQGLLHRVATVRIAALRGLGHFVGRADIAELVALGLRDHDPQVRAVAARTLSIIKARAQVDVLLLAFDRGVAEAAISVGELAEAQTLPAFNAFLGRKPIGEMLAGYHAWLARKDIDEATKLRIIATLEDVASITIKRFLQSLVSTGIFDTQPKVRRAIDATVGRIAEPKTTQTINERAQ